MPSPFPGMDPFLEGQEWADFQHRFITRIADTLQRLVEPRYLARIGERVYLEHAFENLPDSILPDLAVLEPIVSGGRPAGAGSASDTAPFEIPLPIPEEVREGFVEVRLRNTRELVTAIEVLSPTNKRARSTGRSKYISKRRALLTSSAHLMEIDLLRGGERMPASMPLPPADYYFLLSRASRRPMAEVWATTLRDPLPTLPVPLSGNDADVRIDLQQVFAAVYDSAGYRHSLDYQHGAVPPLTEADAVWVRTLRLPLTDDASD